ncbi:UvrD-helicase domain-containing protein, partial [Stomatohabitans albus]
MGSESQPSLFQLDIDLERHPRIALGASAGTGKTYTLQALAVRNLIEGHCKIGELLMVTFTKAAAAEMRQRLVNA